MTKDNGCGIFGFRPKCLQRFTTPKSFMVVYGLLGTVQAMAFVYFVVSLTTMERRFKIPSKTTGIMLSGNEISQILLSLFLSYFGGQRNRPRWISWGVLLCSLSCFILAMPHFLYGPGEDALALTKEYADTFVNSSSSEQSNAKSLLCSSSKPPDTCEEIHFFSEFSFLPAVLVFISQFVLGIGNTLYYSLGNTYMDDNTKKTQTPMLLGYASALRTLGPAIGFILGPICLSLYIDPSLTPLITKDDARWMGAWWLGWIILGVLMFFFSILVGMFPKDLPKAPKVVEDGLPQYPKFTPMVTEKTDKDEIPFAKNSLPPKLDLPEETDEKTFKDFPQALRRVINNKILMSNIFSIVFYILGSSAYITYMAKYIEVQFNRPAASSTIIAGPAILIGIVAGFLLSGWYISKKKPVPRRLLLWNVIVGIIYLVGEISYIFISCPQSSIEMQLSSNERPNLITQCNQDCMCEGVKYSPVCHKPTEQIYFSACHAGCKIQLPHAQVYNNCSCIDEYPIINLLNNSDKWAQSSNGPPYDIPENEWNLVHAGSCAVGCIFGYYMFAVMGMIINILGSSSKIGNVLVNYRSVEKQDKSFAQGMLLLLVSLCALIPGPILYGAIIDSTCVEWGEKCGQRTNCLMYDKVKFRFYINITAFCFTSIAVILDTVVWYLSKDLDLYGEDDENKPAITPTEETKTQF